MYECCSGVLSFGSAVKGCVSRFHEPEDRNKTEIWEELVPKKYKIFKEESDSNLTQENHDGVVFDEPVSLNTNVLIRD